MPLTDLSVDIWYNIIKKGLLRPSDFVNLIKSNVSLYKLLNTDLMWSSIGHNQLTILLHYELEPATQTNLNSLQVKASIAKRLTWKEKRIINILEEYELHDSNIAKYLDLFSCDPDYIPIVIGQIESLEDQMDACLDVNASFDKFAKLSLLHNLLSAQNIRIFWKSIETYHESSSKVQDDSYENFWFRISFFDKSFHRLVAQRSKAFTTIKKWLHYEIFIDELVNQRRKSIKLITKGDSTRRYTILFSDKSSIVKFIVRCMRIVCKYFQPFDTSRIEQGYTLEDFSIMRIYSHYANGHPLLLMSIMVRIVQDFLLAFIIQLPNTVIDLKLTITKNFIRLFNYFLKLTYNHQLKTYYVLAFTMLNVTDYMRVSLNYNDDAISNMLEPVSLKYLIEFFLNTISPIYNTSMPRARGVTIDSINSNIEIDKYFQRKLAVIQPQEFEFIKYIGRYFICNSSDEPNKLIFKKLFFTSNNFIYFKSIMDLKNLENLLKRLLGLNSGDISLPRIFELNNFNYFNERWTKSFNPHFGNIENSESSLLGNVVYHSKFQTLGIVTNCYETESRYQIITIDRELEVYNASSIIPLSEINCDRVKLLKFVIYSCGIDILGLLFFEKIAFFNDYGRLVTPKT